MKIKIKIYFLLCLFVTACATVSPPLVVPKNNGSLTTLNSWEIEGRASIQARDRIDIVSFNWQQLDSQRYVLQFFAPLGIGSAVLTRGPNGVALQTSNRRAAVSALSTEALLNRELGWSMPLSNLFYWIRG